MSDPSCIRRTFDRFPPLEYDGAWEVPDVVSEFSISDPARHRARTYVPPSRESHGGGIAGVEKGNASTTSDEREDKLSVQVMRRPSHIEKG